MLVGIIKLWNTQLGSVFISTSMRVLVGVFVLPLVVKYLPVTEVNVYFSMVSLIGIFLALTQGLSVTFQRFLAYSNIGIGLPDFDKIRFNETPIINSESNLKEFSKILATYRFFSFISALGLLTIGGFAGYYALSIPISQVDGSHVQMWLTFLVLLILSSINLYLSVFNVILRALDKIILVSRVALIWSTVTLILLIILMLQNKLTLFSLILVVQMPVITGNWHYRYLCSLHLPKDLPNESFDRQVAIKAFEKAWKSILSTTVAGFISNGTGLILANYYRAEISAPIQLLFRVYGVFENLINSLMQAKVVHLTRLSKENRHLFKSLVLRLLVVLVVSAVMLQLLFLLLGNEVLSILKDKGYVYSMEVLLLMGIILVLKRWIGFSLILFNILNNVRDIVITPTILLSFLGLIYLLPIHEGVNFMLYAFLASLIIAAVAQYRPLITSYNHHLTRLMYIGLITAIIIISIISILVKFN